MGGSLSAKGAGPLASGSTEPRVVSLRPAAPTAAMNDRTTQMVEHRRLENQQPGAAGASDQSARAQNTDLSMKKAAWPPEDGAPAQESVSDPPEDDAPAASFREPSQVQRPPLFRPIPRTDTPARRAPPLPRHNRFAAQDPTADGMAEKTPCEPPAEPSVQSRALLPEGSKTQAAARRSPNAAPQVPRQTTGASQTSIAGATGISEGSGAITPFSRTIPSASLDVILLVHRARPTPQLARFQTLLRALCTLQHAISRAAMLDDRIELQVEDWPLVLGDAGPIRRIGPVFRRPDLCNATRQAARLAYFIDHHALALRLRVAEGAPAALLTDICQLVMQLHRPSAVILSGSGLVLGKSEFETALETGLENLRPGPLLPDLTPRYTRPGAVVASPTPSAFSGRDPAPNKSELRRAEGLAARICIERDSAELAAVFRSDGPVPETDESDVPIEASLCDAVMLRSPRFAARIIAPLLAATLILTTGIPPHPGPAASIHAGMPE